MVSVRRDSPRHTFERWAQAPRYDEMSRKPGQLERRPGGFLGLGLTNRRTLSELRPLLSVRQADTALDCQSAREGGTRDADDDLQPDAPWSGALGGPAERCKACLRKSAVIAFGGDCARADQAPMSGVQVVGHGSPRCLRTDGSGALDALSGFSNGRGVFRSRRVHFLLAWGLRNGIEVPIESSSLEVEAGQRTAN
jgi:hypothetical protein